MATDDFKYDEEEDLCPHCRKPRYECECDDDDDDYGREWDIPDGDGVEA